MADHSQAQGKSRSSNVSARRTDQGSCFSLTSLFLMLQEPIPFSSLFLWIIGTSSYALLPHNLPDSCPIYICFFSYTSGSRLLYLPMFLPWHCCGTSVRPPSRRLFLVDDKQTKDPFIVNWKCGRVGFLRLDALIRPSQFLLHGHHTPQLELSSLRKHIHHDQDYRQERLCRRG